MSRIQLQGSYVGQSFELRSEDGSLYLTVEQGQIFRVGNSIGGFWAKPVTYAGQPMLALIRIGGSKLGWPIARIRRSFGKERGLVLQPGSGLWATSSGSARRGVWHRIREDADPIHQALRSIRLPSNLVRTVDEINEEVYSGGQFDRGGADDRWFVTDGAQEDLGYDEQYCSRYKVMGGTFLIIGSHYNREDCRYASHEVRGVVVTPGVDRKLVASIISMVKTGRCDGQEAMEIVRGLRCSECRKMGCSPSVHEAQRAASKAKYDAWLVSSPEFIEAGGKTYRVVGRGYGGARGFHSEITFCQGGVAVQTPEGGGWVSFNQRSELVLRFLDGYKSWCNLGADGYWDCSSDPKAPWMPRA